MAPGETYGQKFATDSAMEPSKNNGQSLGKGKGREELGAEFYMGTVGSQQHRKPHTCSIKGFALRNSIFFFFFLSLCSSSGLAISNTQIWRSGGAEVPAAAFSSGKHSFQARVTALEKRCRSRASPLPPLFPPARLKAGAGGGVEFKLSPQPLSSLSPRLLGVQGRRWGPPRAAAQSRENRGGLPPWPAAKGTAAEPPAAPDGATGLASWKRLGGGWPAAARAPRVVGRLRRNPPGGLGDLPVALLSLVQGWSLGGSNRRQRRLSWGSQLVFCFFS